MASSSWSTPGRPADATAAATGVGPGDPASFLLVHGLASNARMWDGVAAALVANGHRAFTVDLRGHGRSSKPDGPYDVPTVADDLAALIDALGLRPPDRRRPVVGRQRRPGAGRPPSGRRPGDRLRRRRLARAEPRVPRLGGLPGRARARPASSAAGSSEIEGYIRSAHRDWPESGIRGTLANFEVRPDGTIAPWLTFERHLDGPARAVGAPPERSATPPSRSRSCSPRPTAARPTGPGASDATSRRQRPRSRTRPGPLVRGRPRHPCPAPGRTRQRDA